MQQLQLFRSQPHSKCYDAGEIGAWPIETGNQTECDRVCPHLENDRNGRGCCLGGSCRGYTGCDDQRRLTPHEISGQRRQAVVLIRRPQFHGQVLSFDITTLAQADAKRSKVIRVRLSSPAEEPY